MLLVVDVGNTNAVFGLYPAAGDGLQTVWRLPSRRDRTADEWFALLSPLLAAQSLAAPAIQAVTLSSVVPSITDHLVRLCREHLGLDPLVVHAGLDFGIAVKTDSPRETGTDRIVNAAAAYARFGGPTIVVDLGTATKIEAITAEGEYLGGVIAPGLGLSLDSLASRAARLYAVTLDRPPSAIGRNTTASVQSGVVEGHLAMIEGMVDRVRRELGGANHVALTGGYSPSFAAERPLFTDFEPTLTLDGLRMIHRRNVAR